MTTLRAPSKIIPRAFPGIQPAEVEELVASSRVCSYPAGTVLCRENAVEHTFYLILSGEVEVSKSIHQSEVRLLKTLRAGDFFGEMALIHNAPRAATVSAKTDVTVLEVSKEAFDRVLRNSPSISLAMVREISNRLRQNDEMAIEDLRMRAAELAQAYQKLAEEEWNRREFLSMVAHELRTPLMAASGYLQLLEKDILSGEPLREAIHITARHVGQIAALVNDILFLQEMELVLPDFRPVDMGEMVQQVAAHYQEKARGRGIQLQVQAAPRLPRVSGDAKSLERALIALVDNAIKFSPNGGEVAIRLQSQNEHLVIEVEDHGVGIEAEALPRIFDRFYHRDRSGEELVGGLGLGLAITRQVILQHKGRLEVTSTPGQGSTFTILLPALVD